MATKKIPARVLEHFTREFARWVDDAHKGNHTHAARALGLTQGGVSALYNGERGPGLSVLLVLSEKTGRSMEDWLGIKPKGTQTSEQDRIRAAVRDEMDAILREHRAPALLEPAKSEPVTKKKGAS